MSARLALLVSLLVPIGAHAVASAQAPSEPAPPEQTPQQESPGPPSQEPAGLEYTEVDRATVRVFALHGVRSARVESSGGIDRLIAVPDARHGSGVLVGDRGVVLTARHVVEDAELLAVWVPGEDRAYPARLIHAGEDLDFAFIAIAGSGLRSGIELPEHAPTLRVRQIVHAIGYPLDARRTTPQSSQGIVAGTLPTGYLQLGMALNPGNSGGPLIDEDETLVGIVVARGDPHRGVQGIGVAVPLGPLQEAYATSVIGGTALAAAQGRFGDAAREAEVAELVTLLAQVGATELIQEVIEVVENHGRGDILPRLRTLADQSDDPEVMALTAAYFWDVAAVILERGGGHLRASSLPAGPQQTLARELLRRSIALCRVAAQRDPTMPARSPFVAHVVHYMADVVVDEAPSGVPLAPNVASSTPSTSDVPVEAAPGAAARRPRWFALRMGVGVPSQPAPGFGIDGFFATIGVVLRPWIPRIGPLAIAPQLVFETSYGVWGSRFAVDIQLHVGAQLRLGDERLGFLAEAAWAPSYVLAERSGFSEAGWSAAAGFHLDQIAFLLGWRGTNVPQYFSLHVFELVFEVTP